MAVDRCTCTGVTFAQVKLFAEETGATFQEVLQRTNCGETCGLCVPYMRIVLLTGMIDLPVLTPDEYRRLLAQHSDRQRGAVGSRAAATAGSSTRSPGADDRGC